MKLVERFCLFALMFVSTAALAQAQTGSITGVVTDSSTNQPLTGARVSVVGTTLATQTADNGRFNLGAVPVGVQQVRIQRIGFAPRLRTVTVRAGEAASVSVELLAQATQLSAVVAVGYGTQLRRDVTGSVSTVTTEAIDKAPMKTIDQMLQGTTPGVQVTTASSEPGGAISIRIRGTSSLTGNSEPLYVIDGFPIENDMEGSSAGDAGRSRTTPPNPLVTLNPSDIESISVLKDASATAIYGARGANGVVIITTKQGRGTKPEFSLDWYTGTSTVAKRYSLLNASEYMAYANEFGKNSSQPYTPFPDSVRAAILASGVNTDWQDEIFRKGVLRNLQMGVRGATNNSNPTRYALSLNSFGQQGIVVGSGLRRLSGRINLNQSLGSRFEVGGSLTGAQARSKSTPTSGQQNGNAGAVSAALQYVPILPVKRPDGTYSYLATDLNAYNSLIDAAPAPNPVSLAREVTDSLSDTRLLGNIFGQATIHKDFKLKLTLGTDYADRWRNTYYPRTTLRGQQAPNGQAIRAASTTASWLNENTLTYSKRFGSQSLDLLGGYSWQRTDADGSSMTNSNFVNDVTGYFDIGAGTQTGGPSVSSRHSAQTLASWISRMNYSLLDRYLATFTFREDGSSRFAVNKKWGAFPSGAFAWRASSEPWFRGISALNDLKFRISYGLVGNPSIRPYQSLASLNNTGYSFGGNPVSGYFVNVVGNPDLTWETTRQLDEGVDLALWDRFNLTADVYRKRTSNLLLQVSLPFETGFESALANRGAVENKGFELGLDADVIKGDKRDFRWHTNFNYAHNRNKVLSLGGESQIFADLITTDYNLPGTLIQVGQPIGMFYGFKSLGIIRDSAQAAGIKYKNFNNSTYKPGDMLIANLNGDDSTTLADRTVIGDPTPDFTYGMTNTFSFGGFELTGLLQGQKGGKVLNVNRIRTESSPRANITSDRWYNRWTPANPDAKYPRLGENPNQVGPNNITDNILESASYLRLRTLTLSRVLPSSFAHIGLGHGRAYITGTNLWTKTKYTGFDPDVSAQSVGNLNRGIDIGAYPLAKSVTTGVTLSF
jgi:TonB-linked SusC/RagA family outer membrane protein